MKGPVVILSGPSGVGKDTVLLAWQERNPRVARVVACTTRAPRPGERDGVDYRFCTETEFQRMAEERRFLEYKNVHGNWYATPLDQLEMLRQAGKIAVLKIDVQGALTAMELLPEAISIFLLPPSPEVLEQRLRARKSDDEESIRKRLQNALDELALARHYQHRIVNDDLAATVDQLEAAVGGVSSPPSSSA